MSSQPTENPTEFPNGLDFNPSFFETDITRDQIKDIAITYPIPQNTLIQFPNTIGAPLIRSNGMLSEDGSTAIYSYNPNTDKLTLERDTIVGNLETALELKTNNIQNYSNQDVSLFTDIPNKNISFATGLTSGNLTIGTSQTTGAITLGNTGSSITANATTFTSNHTIATTSNDNTINTTAFTNSTIVGALNSFRGNDNTFTNLNTFTDGISVGEPTTITYETEPSVGQVGYVITKSSGFNTTQISATNKDIIMSSVPLTAGVWMVSHQIQWTMTEQIGLFFSVIRYGSNQLVNTGIWRYINPDNFYFMSGAIIVTTRVPFNHELIVKRNNDTYTLNGPVGVVRAVRIA